MGKKQVAVSLRKPPPADPDAFVAGSGPAHAPPAPVPAPANEVRRASIGDVVGSRAGDRREITVYLPVDLAKQLAVRCVELDRDISNVVAEAVTQALIVEAVAQTPEADVEGDAPAAEPEVVAVRLPRSNWSRLRHFVRGLRGFSLGLA